MEKLTENDYEILDACCELQSIKIKALKEENAVLQSYKDVNEDFKTAWEELKAENDRLNKILQEIKAIAERCNLCEECSGIDDCERECGDAAEPCSTYQMQIILNKITKAEEEWK